MNLESQDETQEAARFAQELHNRWGVGHEASCGGTGVLLFLSDLDRAIHVSRGQALASVLTNRRLDKTVDHMKPLLQQHRYGPALLGALEEMQDYLRRGPPDVWEHAEDFIVTYSGLAVLLVMFGLAYRNITRDRRERQAYAQVSRQLNELDRARAEALQGRFQCLSCPICLEPFPEHSSRDAETSKENGEQDESPESSKKKPPRLGSDGLPLVLLRCGHTFDETCWTEWTNSGQGQVSKCPICKQDVSGPTMAQDEHNETDQDHGALAAVRDGDTMQQEAQDASDATRLVQQRQQAEARAMRQYNYERNFRLARLGMRFPRYVRPQQIQQWTQSTYNGSLARDPSFVQSDPARRHGFQESGRTAGRHGGSSGFGSSGGSGFRASSGFGGGSSGGGRGGRW